MEDYICDILASWELPEEKKNNSKLQEEKPRLFFKKLFFPQVPDEKLEPLALNLLYCQILASVLSSSIPIERQDAVALAALHLRIESKPINQL